MSKDFYEKRKIILVKKDSDIDKIIEFIRNNENKIIKKQFFIDTLENYSQFAFDVDSGNITCAITKNGDLLVTGNILLR